MDTLNQPILYPPVLSRPLNLDNNLPFEIQLRIKQSLCSSMKNSFYHIEKCNTGASDFNNVIERYSDRYIKLKKASINDWLPVWSRLPEELGYFYNKANKVNKRKAIKISPSLVKRKAKTEIDIEKLVADAMEKEDYSKEDNEENEENDDDNKKEKQSEKDSNDEDNQDIENDEEEIEEENDYIDSYFDNGENYGDEDGGGGDDEGPVY